VPPPVQLVGLEAVQVVQDWNGTIPLVAGKKSYVRAHLQSATPTRVKAVPRARRDGKELALSPLVSNDPDGVVSAPDVVAQRGNLDTSVEWRLPPDWTHGTVVFEVELLDRNLNCVEAAGPTAHDCKTRAVFDPVPIPEAKFVAVDFTRFGAPQQVTTGQLGELVPRLTSALPARDVNFALGRTTRAGDAPPDPKSCDVLDQMKLFRIADNGRDKDGCRRIYYGVLLGDKEEGCANVGGTAGAGYFPANEFAKGRHNHTHEFGHLLGKNHTVDTPIQLDAEGKRKGFCSETAPNDDAASPVFPTIEVVGGKRRPVFGPLGSGEDAKVYGFDAMQLRAVSPTAWFDPMSYCSVAGVDLWPAKSTHEFL
jgi:hypothetical protein